MSTLVCPVVKSFLKEDRFARHVRKAVTQMLNFIAGMILGIIIGGLAMSKGGK